MLAVLAAALALAGAPAGTPVVCNPAIAGDSTLPGYVVYGETRGYVYASDPSHFARVTEILLGQTACAALLYAGASPSERAAIRALNPNVDFDQTVGWGLLVVLHEATHVGLLSLNECLVEKTSFGNVNVLLGRYADNVAAAEADAADFDRQTPPAYHGC